jgi:23S rRNA (cytosine1962-C5)-methyltransferase
VDRYGDLLVAQFATRPMHARRENLAARLLQATGASGLVARAGGFEREEGIAPDAIDFRVGAPPAEPLWVREEGLWFLADPLRGQKTGHYADQRENRVRVGELATGADVLDLYAGTGGFSLQALHHGARGTVAVDASGHALETARINAERNGLDSGLSAVEGDVRAVLQGMKDRGEVYGVVVLDPPNLFPRRGGDGRARKAYRDLNVQAVVRTAPRGFLASFSCSARMAPPDLRELLVSAGRECRRPLRFLRFLEAGPDHPVLGAAREGRYLCGWLAQVGS